MQRKRHSSQADPITDTAADLHRHYCYALRRKYRELPTIKQLLHDLDSGVKLIGVGKKGIEEIKKLREEYKKNIQQEYNALTERLEWLYQRWEELEKINNA